MARIRQRHDWDISDENGEYEPDDDESYITVSSPYSYATYDHSSLLADQSFVNEPPLLDELEINPMRIIETALAVVNPFHEDTAHKDHLLFDEPDLAGPVLFAIVLGAALTLSGGETRFGCIYGLSIGSVFAMFFIAQLMGQSLGAPEKSAADKRLPLKLVSIREVASALGYGQLPVVWLAVLGIVMPLQSLVGALLAVGAVALATRAASAQFCRLTGNPEHQLLMAYPCGLVYLAFVLVVIF